MLKDTVTHPASLNSRTFRLRGRPVADAPLDDLASRELDATTVVNVVSM